MRSSTHTRRSAACLLASCGAALLLASGCGSSADSAATSDGPAVDPGRLAVTLNRIMPKDQKGSRFEDVHCRQVTAYRFRCTGNYYASAKSVDDPDVGFTPGMLRVMQRQQSGVVTFLVDFRDAPRGSAFTYRPVP